VLERADGVGARWRARYEPLRLYTARVFSTLPGYRIPRSYGRYPRREDFVAYLERYAEHHRLPVRFGTALERIDRGGDDVWRLETSTGPLLARYAVVTTGYDAVPKLPDWPGRDGYAGELIHATDFRSPEPYRGREVLIVGAGNTGVDIAGHLVAAGAEVRVAMRTAPNIFPREWLGMPLQASAIVTDRLPAKIGDVAGFLLQRLIFGDLSRYGIPRAPEGFQTKFRRTLIGAAIDDGFVAALKAGGHASRGSGRALRGLGGRARRRHPAPARRGDLRNRLRSRPRADRRAPRCSAPRRHPGSPRRRA
jgi:putative flavoprotein involved in K+ transport